MSETQIGNSAQQPFRVLSLDGGGVKGVFSAGFLAGIEQGTGKSVSEHFDLITGTSTGGIIALGLGLGLSAAEIVEFYQEHGATIFPSSGGLRTLLGLGGMRWPKYSGKPLRAALEDVFGTRVLGEALNRLVIVSYHGNSGDIHLLKTAHDERFRRDYQRKAVDIAMATTAAPVYFPASNAESEVEVDGGVWAACPALVGAIEALRVVEPRPLDVRVLSVGTTSEPFYVRKEWRSGGLGRWGLGLVEVLMQAQVRGAVAQAALLVGKENFLRIDPVVDTGRFALDNAGEIPALIALGEKFARDTEVEVERQFLLEPAPPFEPIHKV